MKKISIIFASLFLLVAFGNRTQAQCTDGGTDCYVVINCTNSYSWGSAWDYCTLTISQNGNTLETINSSNSYAPDTVRICTADGPLSFSFSATYSYYAGYAGFTITDSIGSEMFSCTSASDLSGVFLVDAACPTCPKPSNLTVSNITSTSATINWTELGIASNWVYNYSLYSTPGEEWIPVTSTNVTINDLNSNTEYYVFVKSACSYTDTSTYSVISFRTECGTTVLPISENFDSQTSIPFCWQEWEYYDYDSYGYIYHYPEISTYSGHSGYNCLGLTTDETHSNSIVSPIMPIQANQVEVSFWLQGDDILQIGYITTTDSASAVFHLVGTAGPTAMSSDGYSYMYENYTISFDTVTTTDSIYVVFRRGPVAGYAQSLYLDDILIRQRIDCPIPENPTAVANVPSASGQVTIDWTDATGTAWQVAYGPEGFIPDTVVTNLVSTTTHPVAITGLDDQTVYDFYVRTVCGEQAGYWSGTHATALPNVYTVINSIDTVTSCGVTIVDEGGLYGKMNAGSEQLIVLTPIDNEHTIRIQGTADFYGYEYYGHNKLRIFAGSDTTGMLLFALDNGSNYNIDLLSEVGTMTIYAAACNSDYASYIPEGFQFYVSCQEKLDCTTPYDLVIDSIEGNSAYVSWEYSTALGEAEGFHLIVVDMETGDTNIIAVAGSERDYHLTGLDQRHTYRVLLALDCEGIDTLSASFATPCLVGGEAQIGEGTETTSNLPTNIYYGNTLSQQLFLSSELEGVSTIYGFRFNQTNTSITDRLIDVYIDTTSINSYNSVDGYITQTTATRRFSGSVHFEQGWVEIAFDSSFAVPAGKNIILTVSDHTNSWSGSHTFQQTPTDSIMALYVYRDSSPYDPSDSTSFSDWSAYTCNYRNSIVFLTPCAETSCVPPTITSTEPTIDSVTLTWRAGSNETAWMVEYREADSTTWIVAAANLSTTTFAIGGLTSSTKYEFRVSSLCADTTIGRTVKVKTLCGDAALPFSMGFEDDEGIFEGSDDIIPDCWYRGSNYPYSYYNYPYTYYYYSHEGFNSLNMGGYRSYVVLPKMEAPIDSLMITFYALRPDTYYNEPEFEVGVATNPDDTSTFSVLTTLTDDRLNSWKELFYYLDSYNGPDGHIFIRIKDADYNGCYIDDILVERIPSCRKLTEVNIENITASSITVNIVDDYSRNNYTIYWIADGATHVYPDSMNVTTTTATISDLSPNTAYRIWARANCSDSDRSVESSPITASTLCSPLAVTEEDTYLNEFEEETSLDCFWQTGNTNGARWNHISGSSSLPAYSGGKAIAVSENAGQAMIVLPTFDFSGMTGNAELSFYYYMLSHDNYSTYEINPISVYYRVGDSGEWTLLSDIDTNHCDSWVKRYFMLPASQGAPVYQVAFWGSYAGGYGGGTSIDDIRIKGETTCLPPSDIAVSNVTDRTAIVSWNGSANAYKVQYRPVGQWSWNARTVSGINSITISPLEMSSNYEVRIITLCDAYEQSDPSEVITFTTDFCGDRIEALSYDATATATTTTTLSDATKYCSYTEVLIPAAKLTGMGNINGLSFKVDSIISDYNVNLQIFAGLTTASTMTEFHYDTNYTMVYDGNCAMLNGWNNILFSTPAEWDGTSNLVLGFYSMNNSYYSADTILYGAHIAANNMVYAGSSSSTFNPLYANLLAAGSRAASTVVPDLKLIGCNPTCHEPVFYKINHTDNSVTVEWYNEGADVQVSIHPASSTDWDDPINVTGTNSFTFTNLPPLTDFEVRIRRNCSSEENEVYSDWVYEVARTDTACSVPTDLTVSNITAEGATFSWTDGAVAGSRWELHIWNDAIDNYYDVTTNPVTITDLEHGGNYHAAVRAYCAAGNSIVGDFCEEVSFDNVCYPPTGLTANRQDNGDIVLTWTPGERNTQWVVAYGYQGFFLNEQLGYMVVNVPTATITGLEDVTNPRAKGTDGTTYGFRVRSICGNDWNSDWNNEEVLVHIAPVGINEVNGNFSFTLMPNPASDRVTLVLAETEGEATVSILSIDGRRMFSTTVDDNRVNIDLTDYASGAYFVQVQTASGVSVRKLVVR